MSNKSYLDEVIYVSQDSVIVNELIENEELILDCINLFNSILQIFEERQSSKNSCSPCNQFYKELCEVDRKLKTLQELLKLSYKEKDEVRA